MSSSSQPVPPLRIQKGTSSSGSPVKHSTPRPLSEIGPTAQRRNSPSYNQATKKMAHNGDSSPFQSSPFTSAEGSSPHLFWQNRDPGTPNRISTENLYKESGSISPTRKSSIERLQRASRVKNSTMYAREQKLEYDPMSIPVIERPLAKNIQGNAYGGKGLEGFRSEQNRPYNHARTDSKSSLSLASPPPLSPAREPLKTPAPNGLRSPSKDQISPTKSSMATSRFTGKALYDPEHNAFGEEDSGDDRELPPGRTLHRHAKSVTFDVAPPQINEYELATPDISSIGTNSREGSYDSEEDDEEDLYYHGDGFEQDDSFDASLEDIEKTPVVGPDDWRHPSPGNNHGQVSGYFDDPFDGPEGSPMPDARPSSSGRPNGTRNDSMNSNGEHRPLPPLPGMSGNDRRGSASSGIERAATNSPRNLPTPPPPASISKADLQGMNGNKMTLEERLHLMMIQDDDRPKSSEGRPKSAERDEQRERRMRRAGARKSHPPEQAQPIKIHEDKEDQEEQEDHEDEDTLDDLPGLGSYQLPPRISRESILRKVNGQEPFTRESDYNLDSPLPSSSPERPSTAQLAEIDPDTPLPSTEDSFVESVDEDSDLDSDEEGSVIVKPEHREDEELDMYAIPDMYQRTESGMESHQTESEVGTLDDSELESHYSDETPSEMPLHESPQFQSNSVPEDDGPPTPRNISPSSISMDQPKENRRISLPEFSGLLNDNTEFGLSLRSYMTPSPPPQGEKGERKVSKMSDAHEYLQGSETPEAENEVVHQAPINEPEESEVETEGETEGETPEPEPQHNSPEPQEEQAATSPLKKMISRPEYDGSEWGPPESEDDDVSDSDSVIHHPVDEPINHPFRASLDQPFRSSIDQPFKSSNDLPFHHPFINPPKISPTPPPPSDSPGIPETVATIKARSGSKLKTRPSVTPSDLAGMREARRQVSGAGPVVPAIPQRHRNRPSLDQDREDDNDDDDDDDEEEDKGTLRRNSSFKNRSLTLDIGGDLGLNLESDFDRVIESSKVAFDPYLTHSTFFAGGTGQASKLNNFPQMMSVFANRRPRQRGYLMRQNTKVVVASSDEREPRNAKSAGNSPTKADNRPQSWVVEPWNGSRKSSSRPSSPRKKPPTGAIPPMPGHESNVATGLGILTEDKVAEPVSDEGSERGRLFVKVIGVKDLDLPLPKNERSWFSLTLDNGVHCVTTAWLELGKNAPIGQEFELVVPNELEFQLTLNAKLEKPAPPKRVQTSPVKATKPSKPSTFSRVFASPKKRKELEMRQKEEEQRIAQQKQQDAQALKNSSQPTAWDLLSPLAAADGSFGRSYVCLKDHETRCFGRPYNVDVAAFNEWATEETNQSSSVMSKRSVPPPVRKRAPYTVGKLQLQLLFVPKPKGASDEDMPKSMNACIREMKEAELEVARQFEGHLSQQGGDCPFWRRRFFRLAGSKLTAYHESTRQPRVTINLANANRLIDDRRALTQKETTAKSGKRRKSGFAEDEEGYMFVEEGFRIRFNNGEVIDFYADSPADKEAWMSVLDPCVGKERAGGKGGWCDLVLKREEHMMRKASGTSGKGRTHSRVKSTIF